MLAAAHVTAQRYEDRPVQRRLGLTTRRMHSDYNKLCRDVCLHCRTVLGLRWTALCSSQCELGGREYDACMTLWSVKENLFKLVA